MAITEEQRKRAEANRLAALAKRNHASAAMKQDPWKLFKCRKISSQTRQIKVLQEPEKPFVDRFIVVLEICAPDEFSITPEPVPDFPFPGEIECLRKLDATLSSVVPFRSVESQSNKGSHVYKLKDYDAVSKCLKKFPGIQLQDIPWKTLAVVKKFSYSFVGDRWIPCMPNHLSDEEVDALIEKLPQTLRESLLPFQIDGLRYGLQRGGHCLIADEMGLGKTLQAIAIACCFMNEGPILVVCPAILRFSWAEELERWLPFCLPTDIHLVFGHQNNVIYLSRCPKIVVISYTMLHRLRKSMLERKWSLMIVDESHNVRCTKKMSESEETKAVLDVASKVKRIILLSGTPSLSRPYDIFHQINMIWPGLLGKDKYEFAKNYCSIKFVRGSQGKIFKDFSNGVRLEELNVLLKQTVMIRRLKEHVLVQLPPKRRQIIRLMLKVPNVVLATAASDVDDMVCMDSRQQCRSMMNSCTCEHDSDGDQSLEDFKEFNGKNGCLRTPRQLSYQEIGIAKLSGFREWLCNHPIITELDGAGDIDRGFSSSKMLIFAHHLKVLDGVQEFASEKGIGFVRIDGSTLSRDRQAAVQAFRSSAEVKVAIIGITAGGVGLDFSAAQNVVFLELPKSASEMLQAEDRAHRRGQTNAVNIYIFCAKNTADDSHWQHLNRSLYRVSSMTNGKDGAIKEIEVDGVCNLERINSHYTALDLTLRVLATQTCTETSEKCEIKANELIEADVNNVIQTGALPSEVDRVADLNRTEDSVEYRSPGAVSTFKFDNSDNKKDQLDSIACEAISSSNTGPTSSQNISANCGLMDDRVCATPRKDEGGASGLIQANENNSIRTDLLRFEVSRYTGRVHLYACIPGKDLRPRPLFENFRSEELESKILSSADINKETAPKLINENPAYWNVLLAFIKEWNDLRPIERNKLLGKPLQIPLNLELCYLKETLNHGFGGLLKGGSKRRVTPVCDISHPLPVNAVWKKITLRSGSAKKEKDYSQAWTNTDEPLCKLCQTPCKGELAKEPEYFEDLFCNLSCFEEYRLRTSQRSLREALFQIEHGVCTLCELDCHKLVEYIRPLSVARRREYIEKVAPKVANHQNLFNKLVYEPSEGNAWHADHIVPVYRGGGECRLENMRTLCVACHSEVTAAQRSERRSERMNAKEQLKLVMAEIKGISNAEQSESNILVHEQPEVGESAVEEDGLLIQVPGSAYSSGNNTATETK